ncbi:unnamed protein product [Amoebophrya sp. A25]|nr:unnamed protein product [Amoebophrya sp. A25]|eukprot:GSA25T00020712001.1
MSPPRPCHLDFAEPSPHPVVRDESKLKEKKRLSWAALTLDDSGDDTDAMKDHGVSLRTSAKAADNNRVLRKTPCSSSTTAKKHLELEVDPVLEEEKANGSTSAGGEAQPSASPSTTSILKKKEQEVVGTSKSSDGGDGILDEEEPGVAVSTEPPAVWTNPDDEEWLEVAEVCASLGITEQEFWHLAGFPEPAVHSSSNNVDQGNNAAQEHVAADQNVVQEGPQSQESSMPHLSGNEDTSRDSSMYALCGSGSTVPLLSSSRNDVLNHAIPWRTSSKTSAGPSSSTLASTIGQEELQACSSVPLFATSEEDSSLIPLAMPVGSVKDKEDSSSLTPQEQAGQQDPSLSAGGQSVTLQLPDGSTCEFLVPAPTAAALPGQIEEEPISWDVAWFGPYSVQKQSATATKCSGGGFRPALGQSSESTSSASLKSMSVKEVAAKIMGEEAPESTPQVEQNDPSYVPNTRHLWAQRDTADAPGVIAPLGRQEEESEVIPMVGEQTAGTNLAESESVPADTSGEAQQQLSNADVEKRELVTKADDPQAEKQGVQVGRSYFRMDLGRTTYAPEPELFRDFFEQEQETEYLQRLEKIIAYVIRFAQAHAGPRHYN